MVGRQLPFFSLIVPFWVVWAFAGFRGMLGVWPAALTAGAAFAIPQFLMSNFHGPTLVDIVASICSMIAVIALLKFWKPKAIWTRGIAGAIQGEARPARRTISQAWFPWILLSIILFIWGLPQVKSSLGSLTTLKVNVPFLHEVVFRMPPVVPKRMPEAAVFTLNWLSATGSAILIAAIISGLIMGFRFSELFKSYLETIYKVRFSLVTISAMLALGYVTKYSGTDATIGLALAKTGALYPFFGTLLGWLGVALTGSDTASNVLFGSLQKITAQQTGINPILMCAANSSGGVMGKMVDAQSIVVASTATNYYGKEGEILRFVFFHSVGLATLVGVLVFLQAYVSPFSHMTRNLPAMTESGRPAGGTNHLAVPRP
jgi:lactate permease